MIIKERRNILNKDLTVGNPSKVLWKFCLPLFASIVFQQLYNIADSLVAGKFIGENALAAVGNSYEITLVFLAFAFGCNMGCNVVSARLFGAGDYRNLKTAVSTSCIFTAFVCIALMLAGLLLCEALLTLIHTPSELMSDSELYLRIYIWGLPFVFFYNLSTGIFSALGDSKTPFYFLAASSSANILCDIVFVTVFDMGIAGVAWATFICQGVSCILAVFVVSKRIKSIEAGIKAPYFNRNLLIQIIHIAVPSTLQQSFISVGNIIIQGQINSFGASVMAGYSAGVKLNNLLITALTTLANGISSFAAQNMGAKKPERIKEGIIAGIKMVWILSIPVALLYFFGGKFVLLLFLNTTSEEAIDTGLTYLRILSPFYIFVSAKLVADGILRGMERMKQFMASTFTDLLLRVILASVLSKTVLGATGIWCAWPVGWLTATCISFFFLKRISLNGKTKTDLN